MKICDQEQASVLLEEEWDNKKVNTGYRALGELTSRREARLRLLNRAKNNLEDIDIIYNKYFDGDKEEFRKRLIKEIERHS